MPKRKAAQPPSDDEHTDKKQKTGGAYPLTISAKRGKKYGSDSKGEELVYQLLFNEFGLGKNLVYENRFYKELKCDKTGCDCNRALQLDYWIPKFKVGIEVNGSPHRVFEDFKSVGEKNSPKKKTGTASAAGAGAGAGPTPAVPTTVSANGSAAAGVGAGTVDNTDTKTEDKIREKFSRYQFHDKFKSEKMTELKLHLISADFGTDINVTRRQMCDYVQTQLLAIPEFKAFVEKKQKRKKPVPKHIKEEKEKARKHKEWVDSHFKG